MIRARRFKIWGLNPLVCYDAIIGGETSIPRIDMPECARPNVSSSGLLQSRLPEMATRPFRDVIAGSSLASRSYMRGPYIGFLRGFAPRLPSSTIAFFRSQSEQASAVSLHLCF
jgi:hypothetical protein